MNSLKTIIVVLVVLLLAGCVATAIAYPFFGRTSPPDDVGHGNINPDPDPNPVINPGQNLEPSEPDPPLIPRPDFVRGLYVTGNVIGWSPVKSGNIFNLIRETGLNTLVIDVKNDVGEVTYKNTRVQLALEAGANKNLITSTDALFETLVQDQIYPIARIVVAKDQYLWKVKPEWFLQDKEGGVWNKDKTPWADLRQQDYWDYLLDIAFEAIELGFREIQFDYVRWPSNSDGPVKNLASVPDYNLTDQGRYERTEVIRDFLKYAKDKLAPYNVEVSADIFGIMGTAKHEETIGQQLELILSSEIDIICPMMYPGHYATGFHPPNPNRAPYEVVYASTEDYIGRMGAAGAGVLLRPWLQAFTDGRDKGFVYGSQQIADQMRALDELGIREFLFWDASNTYYGAEAFRARNWE